VRFGDTQVKMRAIIYNKRMAKTASKLPQVRGEAWNRSFPHSSQKEPALLTP